MFKCDGCNLCFTRKDNLKRHEKYSCRIKRIEPPIKRVEPPSKKCRIDMPSPSNSEMGSTKPLDPMNYSNMVHCEICDISILRNFYQSHLRSQLHKNYTVERRGEGVEIIKGAFKNKIVTYRLTAKGEHLNFNEFFDEIRDNFHKIVRREIEKHKLIKVNVELFGFYVLPPKDIYELKSFNTKNEIFCMSTNTKDMYDSFKSRIISKAEDFQERDSGNFLIKLNLV